MMFRLANQNLARSAVQRSAQRSLASRFFASAATEYDAVVIGGGPGGYVAAIKGAQLGLKVACIETRGALGGTCLNVGCIPSKALLHASHLYHEAKDNGAKYGIKIDGISVDLPVMMEQKGTAVKGLTSGIEGLFKKNKVDYIKGFGSISDANTVDVKLTEGGNQTVKTKNIVIATGSEPSSIPNVTIDENRIVSSTGALSLPEIPKKLVVIGAGVIGLELGSVWSRLGAEVEVVEFLDRITPGVDKEIATQFQRVLQKQGLKFKLGTAVQSAEAHDSGVKLTVAPSKGGDTEIIEADYVLVATGRRPFVDGLGIDKLNIEREGPFVKINEHWQTNVNNIYAIGDVAPGPMLAHKAEEEGIAVMEKLAKGHGHVNYNVIPGVIYTHPEVAQVGRTEEELKAAGVPYRVGKFPMMANSRARANQDADGLIKVIVNKETDRIEGVHMLAAGAGEMIHEAVVGMEYGASAEDIARSCHAHPTNSEAVKEACMAAYDKPIHF